jgi:hypothetical protein
MVDQRLGQRTRTRFDLEDHRETPAAFTAATVNLYVPRLCRCIDSRRTERATFEDTSVLRTRPPTPTLKARTR